MNKPSTLDEQIARAQRAIACWPEGRVRMMQLQGTDSFSVSQHTTRQGDCVRQDDPKTSESEVLRSVAA